MIRPIDMALLKNIDEVARINRNKEVNILNQQINALHKLENQQKLNKEIVVKTTEAILNPIDVNKNSKEVLDSKVNRRNQEFQKKKKHRGKDPNIGRWIDIEI